MRYLPYLEIEGAADTFAQRYNSGGSIPVPIEDIVEFDLNLKIKTHKNLLQVLDIDAFLSSDFTELHIDETHYMNQSNRSRFTIAHEVGHIVLHRDEAVNSGSIADWKEFILSAGEERDRAESQANNFAGCLLMPRDVAISQFEDHKKSAEKVFREMGLSLPSDIQLVDSCSTKLARFFDVSDKVAEIRMTKILENPK